MILRIRLSKLNPVLDFRHKKWWKVHYDDDDQVFGVKFNVPRYIDVNYTKWLSLFPSFHSPHTWKIRFSLIIIIGSKNS